MVLLSLGSNIGDKKAYIHQAVSLLKEKQAIEGKIALSAIYETEPYGCHDQPWFANAALLADTSIDAYNLLILCKSIEQELGRQNRGKWREREIDIDIILLDKLIIESEGLIVPHPLMHERNFVLVPCAEIAGSMVHPVFNKTISELLSISNDNLLVKHS